MPEQHPFIGRSPRIFRRLQTIRNTLWQDIRQRHWGLNCALCGLSCTWEWRICHDCMTEMPLNQTACRSCALPLPDQPIAFRHGLAASQQCLECQNLSTFEGAFAPFLYQAPFPFAIHQFKELESWLYGDALLELFRMAWQQNMPKWHDQIDLIAPVPIHWRRLWKRGFNQSDLIAQAIGSQLNVPVKSLFSRHTPRPKQQGLNRSQRLANTQASTYWHVNMNVKGKNLLLVDDVVTTGATLQTLARLSQQAGIQRVYITAIARTPKPHQ